MLCHHVILQLVRAIEFLQGGHSMCTISPSNKIRPWMMYRDRSEMQRQRYKEVSWREKMRFQLGLPDLFSNLILTTGSRRAYIQHLAVTIKLRIFFFTSSYATCEKA